MAKIAAFTISHNERYFLPLWLRYYSRYFKPDELYVLDHDSTDGSTSGAGFQRVPIINKYVFDHSWLLQQVRTFQAQLFGRYDVVLFAETDEFLAPHPCLGLTLREYVENLDSPFVRATGWAVAQVAGDSPLNSDLPILQQRQHGVPAKNYCKCLISKIPLNWAFGFHDGFGIEPSPDLLLLHLHGVDFTMYWNRKVERLQKPLHPSDGNGYHNRIQKSKKEYELDFLGGNCPELPDYVKEIVI